MGMRSCLKARTNALPLLANEYDLTLPVLWLLYHNQLLPDHNSCLAFSKLLSIILVDLRTIQPEMKVDELTIINECF
jgi:hypothetical protein